MPSLRSIAAVAATVTAFAAAPAWASTVTFATLDIVGKYGISSDPSGGNVVAQGNIVANLLAPFPTGVRPYTLSADITLNNAPAFSGSIPASFDAGDAIDLATPIVQALIAGAGTPTPIGNATVTWGGSINSASSTFADIFYDINVDTPNPISVYTLGSSLGVLLGALDGTPFADTAQLVAGLIPQDLLGLSLPDNDRGDYKIALQISQIPLPAAGWLMLAGLGGLAVLRRRQTARNPTA